MSTPPDDPFEGEFPAGFESFSEELQEFTRNLDRARPIVSALSEAGSFQELLRAVSALDDDERDAALIMTFIDLRRQTDPNWVDWLQR